MYLNKDNTQINMQPALQYLAVKNISVKIRDEKGCPLLINIVLKSDNNTGKKIKVMQKGKETKLSLFEDIRLYTRDSKDTTRKHLE